MVFNRAYTRSDRRRNRSERSSRRQSPVGNGCSIKPVFVTATIACSVYTRRRSPRQSPRVYTTGDCRRDDTRGVYTCPSSIAPCIRPMTVRVYDGVLEVGGVMSSVRVHCVIERLADDVSTTSSQPADWTAAELDSVAAVPASLPFYELPHFMLTTFGYSTTESLACRGTMYPPLCLQLEIRFTVTSH